MIEPRSRGWLCCSRKQMLSNFVSSKHDGNAYRFESHSRNVARYDCSVRFASPLSAIFQRLAVTRFQAQAHAN